MSFPEDDIDVRLKDIGLLLGLLKSEPNSELSVVFDWFADPIPYLKNIPQDRDDLLNLLRDLLGDPAKVSPDGNAWYLINWKGKATPVYLVIPKDNSGDSSLVSAGLYHPFTKDDATFTIDTWTTIPLFELPLTSPIVVTGNATHPITLALDIKSSTKFTATDKHTFDGLEFKGLLHFEDDPTFELSFLDLDPADKPSTQNTLAGLLAALETISNWMNPVLANDKVKAWLATEIPSTGVPIGQVFVDLGVLNVPAADAAGVYTFGTFDTIKTLDTAQAIAEWMLAEGLKVIANREKPIVALGKGGVYVTKEDMGEGAIDYGLRLAVPDIDLGKKAEKPAEGDPPAEDAKKPNQLKLQLGKYLTGESKDNNWVKRADPKGTHSAPGVSFYIVRETGTKPSFRPRLDLVSLGLDFTGAEKTPLASVKGFSLGGVEPRFYLSLDFKDMSKVPWGGSIRADHIGLPVGNVTGATGNPVAQNLLSSGDDAKGAGSDKQAVAPEFSAAISFIHDPDNKTVPNFQLYDEKDKPSAKVTLPIQRKFGPLFMKTLGLGWAQPNPDLDLDVIFNGSVQLASLGVTLKDLSVGIPLRTPGDISAYSLGLEGLDFELKAGSVEIAGGLFKDEVVVDGEKVVEYNGTALVKVGNVFTLSALGSWAELDNHPSLFLFALVDIPLGGPPYFFVTGLSGGFGYNRALKIPAQDKVQDFPLVAGLATPSAVGGKDAGPTAALNAIKEYVPPAQGVNFLAAGVQFTTFEIITSNALVVVEFGKTFEVAILGLSRLKLPQVGDTSFVYVELGLRVLFLPSEGEVLATLAITPNSYVLTPECKLTGGFAFAVWFDPSPHAGDFVVTIGGYASNFQKPDWYPEEPRLGFNWKVSDQVTITGEAYFALTPSVAMGGGSLDVQFHAGPVKAWFTAHADFMIQWKPFHFEAVIGVSIGVAVTVQLLFVKATVKAEVGASVNMWGPPIGGIAKIELWIVTVSVGFGADRSTKTDYISFASFSGLLPQDSKAEVPNTESVNAAVNAANTTPFNNVLKMVPTAGQLPVQAPDGRWLVRGRAFRFDLQTAWPILNLHLANEHTDPTKLDTYDAQGAPTLDPVQTGAPNGARDDGYFVGVRGMGINCAASDLYVTITREGTIMNMAQDWMINPTITVVPEALWGAPIPAGQNPTPSAKTLPGRMMGLTQLGANMHPMTGPDPISDATLALDPINPRAVDNNLLAIPQNAQVNVPTVDMTSVATIATTIAKSDPGTGTGPADIRAKLFAALGAAGVNARSNGDMQHYVDATATNFAGSPMLGSVA